MRARAAPVLLFLLALLFRTSYAASVGEQQINGVQEGANSTLSIEEVDIGDINVDAVFKNLVTQPNDPEISDLEYFKFDEKNLNASGQGLFYALWSIKAQENPQYKELGEWTLFGKEYLDTYNFKCSFDQGSCQNSLSLRDIQSLYPGPDNRPLVRLIYFTVMKYELLHDYSRAVEREYHNLHQHLAAFIPALVTSFTKQVDPKKVQKCEQIEATVEQIQAIAISTASTFLAGYDFPIESVLGKGFKKSVETSFQNQANRMQKAWGKVEKYETPWETGDWKKHNVKEIGVKRQLIVKFDAADKIKDWIKSYAGLIHGAVQTKIDSTYDLDQGFGRSILCGAFEGDDIDRNEENKVKVQEFLAVNMRTLEETARSTFQGIYEGKAIEKGSPSLMGVMMINRKWSGPGSVDEQLRNMEPMRRLMERTLTMFVISDILAKDGNYIKCTHRDDAERICKEAEGAKDSLSITVFCPRPDDDPRLLCQTARWRYHLHYSHEVHMSALNTLDTFQPGRFKMSRVAMLTEAYNNYLRYGNVLEPDWTHLEEGNWGETGFRMAVCQNDQLRITDFAKKMSTHEYHKLQWGFPGFCGNFRGDETRGFMDLIRAGIGSQPYNQTDFDTEKLSGALYRDRIPRVLDGLPPFSHYMGLGEAGIQFPIRRKNPPYPTNFPHNFYRFFTGIDEEFEQIKNATDGMTEWQSNFWFCDHDRVKAEGRHTVFNRERSYANPTDSPISRFNNHKRKCEKWLKDNIPEIDAYHKGERW